MKDWRDYPRRYQELSEQAKEVVRKKYLTEKLDSVISYHISDLLEGTNDKKSRTEILEQNTRYFSSEYAIQEYYRESRFNADGTSYEPRWATIEKYINRNRNK